MATSTEHWLALAQAACDAGQVQAAFEMYEAALAKDPTNIEVLETYGEHMLHYGDPDRARQMLMHAAQVSPDKGHVKYLNLAQLENGHASLNYYESACRVLLSELAKSANKDQRDEIHRTLATTKCAMAELYLTDLCDDDDAEFRCETYVNDADRYCSTVIDVHQTRASLRLSQQRPDDAVCCLQQAIKLTHELPEEFQPPYEAKMELGKLVLQVNPQEAFAFFLELLQLDDRNPEAWFLLGESARLCEKWHDAARLLRHARLRVVAADEGDHALAEVDESIRLLVDSIGVEAVNQIPNMDAPNPLDFLDNDFEDGKGEGDDEECPEADDDQWEDVE